LRKKRHMTKPYRYYVRAPDGAAIYGFDAAEAAQFVALEYGPGAVMIDTLAQAYMPMLQEVVRAEEGNALVLGAIGGWDTGRFGPDRDLIESIRKGHVAIVHAFLAKGASANACDTNGGTALHWAAGRGAPDVVALLLAHGADRDQRDGAGRTALDVAEKRGKADAAALLRQLA
jgi:hypothetical protein